MTMSADPLRKRASAERLYDSDEPVARDGAPKHRAAADRMDSWIANAPEPWVAAPPPEIGPPDCRFSKTHDFDRCGREGIPGATLYVHAPGDLDAIDANDVQQGRIGDCHLLGPVIALVQHPEGRARVRSMIKEVERDGKKYYEVTFRLPLERTVTEKLRGAPATKDVTVEVGPDFVNGHAVVGDRDGDKAEVWPLVLEAAYAKLRGGTNRIHYGNPAVALAALSGKAVENKLLEKGILSYSGSDLKRDFAARKPMVVSFFGGPTQDAASLSRLGLSSPHTYALVGIYEKDGEKLAVLQNPWGTHQPPHVPLRTLEGLKPTISIGKLP
jgi:hypothetical protein